MLAFLLILVNICYILSLHFNEAITYFFINPRCLIDDEIRLKPVAS